jgi:hypothetical protein
MGYIGGFSRPQKRRKLNGVYVFSVPGVWCGILDHAEIVIKIYTKQQWGSHMSATSPLAQRLSEKNGLFLEKIDS